ncbi:BON domain-containing protein [Candidatus Spongiihabitans sp.]|uniref:BON domain-containing protein n=1 Tax=Candidatus Spongiihabitans sp. TaxID=3101308 RepID=UPI003C7E0E99
MANIRYNRKVSLKTLSLSLLIVVSLEFLSACVPIIIGAAAVSAVDLALERRTAGRIIDDNFLELKLRNIYSADEQLGVAENISVVSFNGIVLLTGEVHTDAQRQRAEALVAEQSVETRKVVNELDLSGKTNLASRANDSYITGKVKAKLIRAEHIPSSNIKVITERGGVYLLGLVTRDEAEAAVEVTKSVRGVTRIIKVFEYIEPE